MGVDALQAPSPLQYAKGVYVPLVQLSAPHWTLGPAMRQLPLPSQVPSSRQVSAPSSQSSSGSRPLRTKPHVPSGMPVASSVQALHAVSQATSQHTPSMQ
jgi:hypothetical protein